jgi:hypothetical protein
VKIVVFFFKFTGSHILSALEIGVLIRQLVCNDLIDDLKGGDLIQRSNIGLCV